MLVPLLLNLASVVVTPVNATATAGLATVTVYVMRPLWVSENPTDTIVVTPNPTPVGSFQ
jgi:hypothetical protein